MENSRVRQTEGLRVMAVVNNAVWRGKRNRAAGRMFEMIIDAACRWYRQAGIAEIEKTPEPMRPLGHQNDRGQFLACYEKKAQPDYKGTIAGGRSIVFEAKHTDTEKMQQSVVSEEQEKALDRHEELGALCFVIISFGFKKFYKIPWEIWKTMKERFGRKYLTPDDVPQYEVKYSGGMLNFLRETRR